MCTSPAPLRAAVIGASGGIGSALVEALNLRPHIAEVVALSRVGIADSRDKVTPAQIDITDEASVARAAAASGPFDLIIVATGVLILPDGSGPEKSLRALDPAAMATSFAVNAIGPALIAKHFLPQMPRDRRSVFAVLSARVGSISDNRLGGWYSYRAGKAALNMILRTAAIEQRRTHPHSILAALHPGTVGTDLSAPFVRRAAANVITPHHSAEALLAVLDRLGPDDSGDFFGWDGNPIPF